MTATEDRTFYFWNLHHVAKFALLSSWKFYGKEGIRDEVKGPIAYDEDEETQEQLIKAYTRTMKHEAELETANINKEVGMKQEKLDKLEAKAENVSDKVGTIITKRQLWAYLLTEVADLSNKKAATVMNIEPSTVSSLKNRGRTKIINAYELHYILEEDPFWCPPSLEEFKEEE